MQGSRPAHCGAAPFCHVVRRNAGGKKYYVVHADSPRFVVEMESAAQSTAGKKRAVIRRVCLPNSWTGDYHLSAERLGDAVAFFESTAELRNDG